MTTIGQHVDPDRVKVRVAGPHDLRYARNRARDEVHAAMRDLEMLRDELSAELLPFALGDGDVAAIEDLEAEIDKVERRRRRWTIALRAVEENLDVMPTTRIRGSSVLDD